MEKRYGEKHKFQKLFYEVRHKKTRLTLQPGNEEWEGRDKQAAIEYVLTYHGVMRLGSITLLSTTGRIFKYRCVLILGRKTSDCKSETEEIHGGNLSIID